jgi:arylformamidase
VTLIDISQTLRPGIPVWPGDTPYTDEATWMMGANCPVNVSKISMSTHTGAHADAPLHYRADGVDSAACNLDPYLGPCRVIDARGAGPILTQTFMGAALGSLPPRLLFRTYETFPHDVWRSDWTAIDPGLITHLATRGVRLIGIDGPSLDPQNSKTMDAHQAVAAADMAILEGLVLDHAPPGDYELIALPLKLSGLDASPVRAVLRPLRTVTE